MSNLFDNLQSSAFDIVTNTMGYSAQWTPSQGGELKAGKVLLKNPTETRGYEESGRNSTIPEYNPLHWVAEYKKGVFEGLKEVVDNGGSEEITVNEQQFYVRYVYSKYDGNNFVAVLEPKSI